VCRVLEPHRPEHVQQLVVTERVELID
jgi:hypothetical protein